MADTTNTLTLGRKGGKKRSEFLVNFYSTDARVARTLKAAPGAGKSVIVEWIFCNSSVATIIYLMGTVGGESSVLCSFSTTVRGTAEGCRFENPIVLDSNTALTFVADDIGDILMIAKGFVLG